MSKTSNYVKRPRDFYPTPEAAVTPLKGVLDSGLTFCEPCAGDGRLVDHLSKHIDALCVFACDIEPQADWIIQKDGIDLTEDDVGLAEVIITNPPFTWSVLKPMLEHWINLRTTIVLLPADFMHNKRVAPLMKKCVAVKSIGRVKWIEGSKGAGVENYVWMSFDKNHNGPTTFYGRDF